MKPKIDIVKVVNVAGTVLGIAGTLLTSWSSTKTMKSTIVKEVVKEVAKEVSKMK